jgi:hypothetical protein
LLQNTYGNISASARDSHAVTVLEIATAVIWPLKGFFTFLAYMRPPWKHANTRSKLIKCLFPFPVPPEASTTPILLEIAHVVSSPPIPEESAEVSYDGTGTLTVIDEPPPVSEL